MQLVGEGMSGAWASAGCELQHRRNVARKSVCVFACDGRNNRICIIFIAHGHAHILNIPTNDTDKLPALLFTVNWRLAPTARPYNIYE